MMMLLETLLTAAIETGLGLLAEAGLGDELRDLKDRLLKTGERKRREAFDAAFAKAKTAAGDEAVSPLLEHRPFQEAVVSALLDSVNAPFNVKAAAAEWIEKYPEHARPLTRFFGVLENELLADPMWGPILERFYELRESQAAQAALRERRLDVPPQHIVREVLNVMNAGAGGVAAGGGVAGGAGSVVVGGNVAQIVIQQLILNSGLPPKSADARQRYLAHLRRQCSRLPLAELGGDAEREAITLQQVYIALDTDVNVRESDLKKIQTGELTQLPRAEGGKALAEMEVLAEGRREREQARPLPALDAFRLAPRMALLGDPGAGKSTFVKELLARVCGSDPSSKWLGGLLPVFVELRALAPRLAEIDLRRSSAEQEIALVEKMREQIAADLPAELKGFADDVFAAMADGACLLALDGLDEVASDLRARVRLAVAALLSRYPVERVLVTCRTRSYVGDAVLPGFDSFTLHPFSDEQIHQFARAWYGAQLGAAPEATDKADDLARAARERHTRPLAGNPMLLTVMAIIHTQDVRLPRERARLYKRAVEILLEKWQKHKAGEESITAVVEPRRLRPALELPAYEAHRQGGAEGESEAADPVRAARPGPPGRDGLPQHVAQNLLEDFFHGDVLKARRFLEYADQRAGLLMGRGGDIHRPASYTFAHRTFQEYLAGSHMLARSESDRVREFAGRAAEGDRWNLAAQLAMEELLYNHESDGERRLRFLAYNLLPNSLADEASQRMALWAGQMAALAGREAIERDTLPTGGAGFVQRARNALVRVLGGALTPPERADAGKALAALGDPRPQAMTVDAMRFCFVPAGPFLMGNNEGDDPWALVLLDESPRHEVALPDYYVGLYPITNAQYGEFVAAGGYKEARYWKEAEAAGRWSAGLVKDAFHETHDSPVDYDAPFNLPNHPVVGVTWYEALAFTRWVTERWRERGQLPAGWVVRLPAEAEWEKAARGGMQTPLSPIIAPVGADFVSAQPRIELRPNPDPARRYAWGSEFISDNANTLEAKISVTSAPGCFPNGASSCGVQEMIGNVWEWCQSKSAKYPYKSNDGRETIDGSKDIRVLRGGAFNFNRRGARCARRDGILRPGGRDDLIGFRVVVSPGSRS